MVDNHMAALKAPLGAQAGPRNCREEGMTVHIGLSHMQHDGIRWTLGATGSLSSARWGQHKGGIKVV